MAMFIADEPGSLHKVKQFTRELAGAETNVAIGLARLGLKSGWVSKVGEDAFGRFIIDRLQEEHVDIGNVEVDNRYPTGFQLKSKVIKGDPEVQYFRKNSAASQLNKKDFNSAYFQSASHLHMTGIPLAISLHTREFAEHALNFMRSSGKTVTFDPNLRPSLWNTEEEMVTVINKAAFQANYVMPGLTEGEILTGYKNPKDIAAFYLDRGVELVIVKLGEEGAYYQSKSEEGIVSGFKVPEVIDTVGAGDGFAVGVISGLLKHLTIEEAVTRGNAIGAMAVQSQGDNDGYPTRNQLNEFLENNKQGVN
ncbi:2-dehydro-3-deoxygluconokinase [Bacillus gobiensis]|uniref:2-dehydro-3-deoxygluconokinase n=2 Tax=Bacillus TaxID=1386 RepID=A0A0M4FV61_9BACI|nr:2-dehydro-3-deoxygluconokinase [Bacillus gobiensis]